MPTNPIHHRPPGPRVVGSLDQASHARRDTATYLLGPVLGFVLRLRGIACLHASAISIDGRTVLLLGPAGSGKSTTAAAFACKGCRVLSEDVCALHCTPDGIFVQPGYPRLRLPNSVGMLFGAQDALPLLTPNWNKRFLDLANGDSMFCTQLAPARRALPSR